VIVDLFAGLGGWSEGLKELGLADVGLEWDDSACATRIAAGHETVQCDVSEADPADFAGATGLIASPPCQAFSTAGSRRGTPDAFLAALRGEYDRDRIKAEIAAAEAAHSAWVVDRDAWLDEQALGAGEVTQDDLGAEAWAGLMHAVGPEPAVPDDRGTFMAEAVRWAEAIEPDWICCEQVPPGLWLWEEMVRWLKERGYSAWAGVLCAADFGVPQTRRRAILIASRSRPAVPPEPTHSSDPGPTLFGELLPWVTMAEALGWDPAAVLVNRRDSPGWVAEHGARENRRAESPAPTMTGEASRWVLRAGSDTGRPASERSIDEPAPTVAFGHGSSDWRFVRRSAAIDGREASSTPEGAEWADGRPATTLAGDARVFAPGGHHANDGRRPGFPGRSENAVKITVEQALVLQGFRPDYPVVGPRYKQFEQVGNAVPPPLASAVVSTVAP